MKEERKSIIKEALVDLKEIQQAADANAKKRLAEEFPKEFNNILKEELNKNKSAKESNVDNAGVIKESDMKNLKETPKVVKETAGSGKPFEEKPKGVQKVAEDVKITDTVGTGDPFDEKAKGVQKIAEEREKDFMGDVESNTPNQGKGEAEKGKIFNEKLKGPTSGKPISNEKKDVSENYNLSELDQTGVNQSLEGAQPMDELLTMEQIEEEIANMGNMAEELDGVSASATSDQGAEEGGIPYNELVEMRNKLDSMIKGMDEQKLHGGQGANKVNAGGPTTAMIDELGMEEQKLHGGQGANKVNAGGPTQAMIDELGENYEITEEDINNVLGANEAPVEESQTRTLSNQKKVTAALPGVEYKQSAVPKMRPAMRGGMDESQKKISSLIEENKKLTKKLNETKKYKETASKLVESYQTVIGKYRNQLKEMAVFNTNLSHVNNLLVNEELALTQEDKVKIINEFKKVDSISSSVNVYKNLMTEMKVGKKTLTESFENKVSASIQPSSKQKLDEVKEKTAYTTVPRMKALIESMEKRGKKII